jgi:pimeloyl-ACP methyl ester carboxylesterase
MHRLSQLRVIIPGLLLLLLVVYALVSLAIVFGASRAEREPFEGHPLDFDLEYDDIEFTPRGGGLTLRGWLLIGDESAPYVIFVHGLGSQRSGDSALEIASKLVQDEGYNVLLFDLRAHGASAGSRVTAGDSERNDVLGAYDFVLSRGALEGKVGLLGFSFGAGLAVMSAAQEPGFAAVVADSPFADAGDLLAQETARKTPIPKAIAPVFIPAASVFANLIYGMDLGDVKPERDVARLNYPVLVIHGDADSRIPISHGLRVYSAAPVGSEIWVLPGAGHAGAFLAEPDDYVSRVEAYLEQRLGP